MVWEISGGGKEEGVGWQWFSCTAKEELYLSKKRVCGWGGSPPGLYSSTLKNAAEMYLLLLAVTSIEETLGALVLSN